MSACISVEGRVRDRWLPGSDRGARPKQGGRPVTTRVYPCPGPIMPICELSPLAGRGAPTAATGGGYRSMNLSVETGRYCDDDKGQGGCAARRGGGIHIRPGSPMPRTERLRHRHRRSSVAARSEASAQLTDGVHGLH